MESFDFQIIDKLETLHSLEKDWNSLARSSHINCAFSSFSWFFNACRIANSNPFVGVLKKNKKITALLPLIRTKTSIRTEPSTSEFLSFQNLATDYWWVGQHDIYAHEDDEESPVKVLAGVIDHADRAGLEMIEFSPFTSRSRILEALSELGYSLKDPRMTIEHIFDNPLVELKDSWKEYLESRSKGFRKQTKNRFNRLEKEHFSIFHLNQNNLGFHDDFAERFLELHLLNWRTTKSNARSQYESELLQNFVIEVFPELRRAGHLNAIVISNLNDKIIGVDIGLLGQETYQSFNTGIDPDFKRLRLNEILLIEGLKKAHDLKKSLFDLGIGLFRYKKDWMTTKNVCFRLRVSTK